MYTALSHLIMKRSANFMISLRNDRVCTDIQIQKPEIISYCNTIKGRIYSLDEKSVKLISSDGTRLLFFKPFFFHHQPFEYFLFS